MKCTECGSRFEGPMTFCPSCGVRADVDLRQLHFRDLGTHPDMACPECDHSLHVLELDTNPPVHIERCHSCHGLFFNPGELEATLEAQSPPITWIDTAQISQIASDFDGPREIVYRPCPVCRELMGHRNFGGRSGVVVDHCGAHGLWLQGSQLRRLTEWWRAGGQHLHQQNERNQAERQRAPAAETRRPRMTGTTESEPWPAGADPNPVWTILDLVLSIMRWYRN
jgi:Zn-finger nucleic acid-binding protein